MTAQIHDKILIDGKKFSIVGITGGELFTPHALGILTIPTITSCWRGYVCEYKISQGRLVLDELQLSFGSYEGAGKEQLGAQTSPPINGVHPKPSDKKKYPSLGSLYENLNLEIRLTGSILAGDGFIQKLYVHMGFQPAWKYENVLELLFEDGKFQTMRDVSKEMEKIRDAMSKNPFESDPLRPGRQGPN